MKEDVEPGYVYGIKCLEQLKYHYWPGSKDECQCGKRKRGPGVGPYDPRRGMIQQPIEDVGSE